MTRILLASLFILIFFKSSANTIIVSTTDELHAADKKAAPGDIILLKNGEWKNAAIRLTAKGNNDHPVIFRAQTPGKVILTGNSFLKIGGDFIVVEGLHFTKGFAGKEAVISFRTDSKNVANNSRVTNTVINSFNNPLRLDDNNWVLFYGKNNRLDHCSFTDKNNMGVLIAVILDDERSRENFHLIANNYFGRRIPLGSNGGEIIRVGVSQHCQFNSNTQIINNFFEKCDGEAEIVSIKSGSNVVKGNLFLESQGSVVLRHGDFNTVEDNIFLGNNKPGTGGIRVVNKGQWVVNNFLSGCRGIDFRSPLTVMNGIPNSPAHRYVQVTDAVITNNTFYNCAPVSFCDGSDAERSLPPDNVVFANNLFYNTKDSVLYKSFDALSGFRFAGNIVHPETEQQPLLGFSRKLMSFWRYGRVILPTVYKAEPQQVSDSLQQAAVKRLNHELPSTSGFSDLAKLKEVHSNAMNNTGANWDWQSTKITASVKTITCSTAAEIYSALDKNQELNIRLIGHVYEMTRPFVISKKITVAGNGRTEYKFKTNSQDAVFLITGGGNLILNNIKVDGSLTTSTAFILSDTSGSTDHYNLAIRKSDFKNFSRNNGTQQFFYASKSSFADSLVFMNNTFAGITTDLLIMNAELDNKGLYAAERIMLSNNKISNSNGRIIDLYRGGNDESTLGPNLLITGNQFILCNSTTTLLKLTGVQRSNIIRNKFKSCIADGKLIEYTDVVRAYHQLSYNEIFDSGKIDTNNFVTDTQNSIK